MNWSERYFGTAAAVADTGDVAWSNANNALGVSQGDLYTNANNTASVALNAGQSSQYLVLTNPGFATDVSDNGIPAGATIVGVVGKVHMAELGNVSTTNAVQMVEMKQVIAGSISGNDVGLNRPVKLSTGATNVHWFSNYPDRAALGGVANLWGNTPDADDVRASDYGLALRVANTHGSSAATTGVDSATVKIYWSATIDVVFKHNGAASPALEAPCVLQCTALGSPNGSGVWMPEECEFRWTLTGPVGFTAPVYEDPRPGDNVNGAERDMATDFVGTTYGVVADVAGDYDLECTHVAPDGSSSTDTQSFTVSANTRPIKFVDPVNGNNGNSGDSIGQAWATVANALTWCAANGRRMWLKVADDTTVAFAAQLTYTGSGGTDDIVIDRAGNGTNPPIFSNNFASSAEPCIRFNSVARVLMRNIRYQADNTTANRAFISCNACTCWGVDDCTKGDANSFVVNIGGGNNTWGFVANLPDAVFNRYICYAETVHLTMVAVSATPAAGTNAEGWMRNQRDSRGNSFAWCYMGASANTTQAMLRLAGFNHSVYQCSQPTLLGCNISISGRDSGEPIAWPGGGLRVDGNYGPSTTIAVNENINVVNSFLQRGGIGVNTLTATGAKEYGENYVNCTFTGDAPSVLDPDDGWFFDFGYGLRLVNCLFAPVAISAWSGGGHRFYNEDRAVEVEADRRIIESSNNVWPDQASNRWTAWNGSAQTNYGYTAWEALAYVTGDIEETLELGDLTEANDLAPPPGSAALTAGAVREDRFGLFRDYRGVPRDTEAGNWSSGAVGTEALGNPEITVEYGGNGVTSGGAVIDLGTYTLGQSVEVELTVINEGTADLTIPEDGITVTDDATLTTDPAASAALVLAPTDDAVIGATPDTSAAGTGFTFRVSIDSDDADEDPFTVDFEFDVVLPPKSGGGRGNNLGRGLRPAFRGRR